MTAPSARCFLTSSVIAMARHLRRPSLDGSTLAPLHHIVVANNATAEKDRALLGGLEELGGWKAVRDGEHGPLACGTDLRSSTHGLRSTQGVSHWRAPHGGPRSPPQIRSTRLTNEEGATSDPGQEHIALRDHCPMGILVPADFPMTELANEEERRVVEILCNRLTDGWVVIPDVGFHGQRDHQLDIVIAHARDGVAVIEVKGHVPTIEGGVFHAHGRPMSPQPLTQAKQNSYRLRDELLDLLPELKSLRVEYGVAFPNAAAIRGDLPPDIDPTQVLTAPALEDTLDSIERLLSTRAQIHQLGDEGLEKLVAHLRPDADFVTDAEARARYARQRLDEICRQHVGALATLDLNRRVFVTGGAGTGKTYLATEWARRAARRGERVLLTCFNQPLAGELQNRVGDTGITIGTFHDIAQKLEGMPPIEIPDDAPGHWWDTEMFGHLHRNWHLATERFDTIIVDEAQDLSAAWITMLRQILDTDGPRRQLLLADTSQEIYRRGFLEPLADDGWTLCELTENCRNTFAIASILRHRFGGATAPIAGPESEAIDWIEADTADAAAAEVGEAIDVVMDERDHQPASMLVATTHRSLRDQLIDDYGFGRWEDCDQTMTICETIHRMKGLEFDHVILVAPDADTSDELLYVGASRAVMSLTIIAPKEVATRMGLCSEAETTA